MHPIRHPQSPDFSRSPVDRRALPPFRFPASRVLIQGVVVGQMRSYR